MKKDDTVRSYIIDLCDMCVRGIGGICNAPGCAMCMSKAPDIPLGPVLTEIGPREGDNVLLVLAKDGLRR
jgi:hypothetical protein